MSFEMFLFFASAVAGQDPQPRDPKWRADPDPYGPRLKRESPTSDVHEAPAVFKRDRF